MEERTNRMARNLLISSAILLTALIVTSAQAADGGRQFLPLGQASAASSHGVSQSGGQFIPLRDVTRGATRAKMLPLNGGAENKVWKLKELRDTPRVAKSKEVPDEVKLAMATGRMPGANGTPLTGEDREKIAAALAPVFAGKRAETAEESLETDLGMPDAVAAGMAAKAGDAPHEAAEGLAYVWPVDAHYTISSPYGPRRHPVTGKQDFHAGIDIPAPQGTRVLAAADGKVTGVGEHPRLGRYVKVTHEDGTYSLYGHLLRWTTRIGESVRAGERIGLVGSTGRSTGPHLDFSIRKDGKPFNPMVVLADVLEEKKLAFAR